MDRNAYHRACRMTPGLGLAAVVFLVIGPATAAGPRMKGMLSGKVVDPMGAPVSGARIWVNTTEPEARAEARTSDDGRFRLGPLPSTYRNPFDLLVDSPGFARQYVERGSYSVYPGIDADLGTIRLERGGRFTGRLLDADGTPCPDARILCELSRNVLWGRVSWDGPALITLTTDVTGCFRTPPLPVADCFLYVHVPGRREASWRRSVAPGAETALETLRLEPEVPVPGVVRDEQGRPIAGVKLRLNSRYFETSDAAGRFTLRGQRPDLYAFLDGSREGYVDINWHVGRRGDGFRWNDYHGRDRTGFLAGAELVVVMQEITRIEGRAVDADTDQPVRLDRIELCRFDRTPDGRVVLRGCVSSGFEQPAPGRFRIRYDTPAEYHLTLHAAGYRQAEAFSPGVAERRTITDLVVRMKKEPDGQTAGPAKRTLTGRVTRDGQPVAVGWAALCHASGFVGLARGRTVIVPPVVHAYAAIRDGTYRLDVPRALTAWYVLIEEPGQPPTQIGPMPIEANGERTLDIACIAGGSVRGRVTGVPPTWEGHLWVVAFTETSLRAEAKVDADGGFTLNDLAPGEYGLKVGHDAYEDSDVPRVFPPPSYIWTDPWARARRVTVRSGHQAEGVQLTLPD